MAPRVIGAGESRNTALNISRSTRVCEISLVADITRLVSTKRATAASIADPAALPLRGAPMHALTHARTLTCPPRR